MHLIQQMLVQNLLFFPKDLIHRDKSLYNPSIVLTTPNFATVKNNLTTLAIPSKIPIPFLFIFLVKT